MSYSTRAEVRDMVKDDALNAIIGDTFIEDPAEREELVSPIICLLYTSPSPRDS